MWDVIAANRRRSIFLIIILGTLLIILGVSIGYYFLPSDPTQSALYGALLGLAIWGVMLLTSFSSGERILLATAGGREVSKADAPQLYNIVEEMKIASGLPVIPKVYLIDSAVPNAFAVGLKPERAAVAVTTGLMAKLNRSELQGVIAHEIGHIVNRDTLFITLAGVTVGVIIILADLYLRGLIYSGGGNRSRSSSKGGSGNQIVFMISLVLAILAPLLAQILYFTISRKREYLADASAAQFTRYPEGLASALEKISDNQEKNFSKSRTLAPMYIVNPMSAWEGSSGLFSTHPPTAERVRVLRGMMLGSSLKDYEKSYRKFFPEGLIAPTALTASKKAPIRTPEESKKPANTRKQLREAKDILHKIDGYGIIVCVCGVKLKIPPEFQNSKVRCPKCKRLHDVSQQLMAATLAATVLEQTRKSS
jgi:heat shock protein HtpX